MQQILKLLADNRAAKPKSRVVSAANEATIYLYDAIVATEAEAQWWGGVSAEGLVKEIRALQVDTIHLRINCAGGDVFAGRAIEQALRESNAKVIAHIDGYAASAASFLMLAASEIEITKGGFVMIHNAWSIAIGNAQDIRKTADLLEKVDTSIVDSYAAKTGQEKATITDWMAKETWFSAQEAVDNGFVDRIAPENNKSTSKNESGWNLSAYKNAPKTSENKINERVSSLEEAWDKFQQVNLEREQYLASKPENEPTEPDNSHQNSLLRQLQLATATA